MHTLSSSLRLFWQKKPFYSILVVIGLILLVGFLSVVSSPLYIIGALIGIVLAMIILKNPWHGMLLLAFCIPFERIGSYDIGGTTIRPSQVMALLTMVSIIFFYLRKRSFPLPKNPTLIPLGIFTVVALVGLLLAPNLGRSLSVLIFTLFTIAVSILIPIAVRTKIQIEHLINALFLSFLVVTIFGIYQFCGDLIGLPTSMTGLRELYTKEVLGFPRVQSTALEPLYFANYLLIPLSLLLSLFFSSYRSATLKSYKLIGLISLGIINLILTVARGGYIAFAVSATIIAAYYFFQLRLLSRQTIIFGGLSILIAFVVLLRFLNVAQVSEKFLSHVSNLFTGASYVERVQTFEQAIHAWNDHPLIGIGSGSFGPYTSAHPYMIPSQGWRIVNNEYLELLAENGIVGLLAILSVFLIVIIRSIKVLLKTTDPYLHAVLLGLLAAFIGILVQYNTFSVLYIIHIWFTIGLLIAMQNSILKPKH